MASPHVKILAVSNVYCRLMHFNKQGDVELGHYHTHDHGTIVSSGEILVEMLSDDGSVISSKIFKAPSFVFIAKSNKHRLTALQDNTVAVCVHAIRDAEGTILSPEFIIDEKQYDVNAHTKGKETFTSYVESSLGERHELFAINHKPKD